MRWGKGVGKGKIPGRDSLGVGSGYRPSWGEFQGVDDGYFRWMVEGCCCEGVCIVCLLGVGVRADIRHSWSEYAFIVRTRIAHHKLYIYSTSVVSFRIGLTKRLQHCSNSV